VCVSVVRTAKERHTVSVQLGVPITYIFLRRTNLLFLFNNSITR